MKDFAITSKSWLSTQSFHAFNLTYQKTWELLEAPTEQDVFRFVKLQNEGLLMRLFLEQSLESTSLSPDYALNKIIQRDFRNIIELKKSWMFLANKKDVQWVVFGLSFVDFRFHLFPITTELIPFSLSPIMVTCFTNNLFDESKLDRQQFSSLQWDNINWKIVEQRITCLSEPLDLFGEMGDCAEESCQTF